MSLKTAIIIPARYAASRLPGKPLVSIAGQSLLQRVVRIAQAAAQMLPAVHVWVAADDERVVAHCAELGVAVLYTPPECASGTDRVAAALLQVQTPVDFVLNLQGDAPFTPPDFLTAMIAAFAERPCDVITPVTRLSWAALDALRASKQTTPFSGTCAVFDQDSGKAFWFSKTIIPAIRNEQALRAASELSPVYRHIGLYGYAPQMLARYASLRLGRFEQLEGLEQLRLLEHGYDLRCVPVDYLGRASMSGVDSPEDVQRAEALIARHGELFA